MEWVHNYQLFLFDFDGLLVDTEPVHYQAYCELLDKHGVTLTWDFAEYCAIAQNSKIPLISRLFADYPALKAVGKSLEAFYALKLELFLERVEREPVSLLPGVRDLLLYLEKEGIPRAVVTHSSSHLVQGVRKNNPLLDTIPHWITREYYDQPKPDPECYQYAIDRLSQSGDRVIGFEDSPKGFLALAGTSTTPVLVQPKESLTLASFSSPRPYYHISSFTEILCQKLPPLVGS